MSIVRIKNGMAVEFGEGDILICPGTTETDGTINSLMLVQVPEPRPIGERTMEYGGKPIVDFERAVVIKFDEDHKLHCLDMLIETLLYIRENVNNPTKPVPTMERRLVSILMAHCGESGVSEGAVETLCRIIRERDELKAHYGVLVLPTPNNIV